MGWGEATVCSYKMFVDEQFFSHATCPNFIYPLTKKYPYKPYTLFWAHHKYFLYYYQNWATKLYHLFESPNPIIMLAKPKKKAQQIYYIRKGKILWHLLNFSIVAITLSWTLFCPIYSMNFIHVPLSLIAINMLTERARETHA